VQFETSAMKALQGADALVIMTEWKAYRSPDWPAIQTALREPVVFDGRNLFEPRDMVAQGIEYSGIGRRA
jgi:UDPglucose 6-dehydrogenase